MYDLKYDSAALAANACRARVFKPDTRFEADICAASAIGNDGSCDVAGCKAPMLRHMQEVDIHTFLCQNGYVTSDCKSLR